MKASVKMAYQGTEQSSSDFRCSDGMTSMTLQQENHKYKGTGGTSQENSFIGFSPAFLDETTGMIYLSRFADGRIAPMHLLDGLPQELVIHRTPSGRVKAVKASITAGFVLSGQFYTREQAASAISQQVMSTPV